MKMNFKQSVVIVKMLNLFHVFKDLKLIPYNAKHKMKLYIIIIDFFCCIGNCALKLLLRKVIVIRIGG